MSPPFTAPFIRRITIRNFKSIAACRLDLGKLTFLVGRNGSGKSNFLKSLSFTADALRYSLDHALREQGTISEVRRRSGGHPNHFALRFDFNLPDGYSGHYSFKLGAKPVGAYEVQDEECVIASADPREPTQYFRLQNAEVKGSTISSPPAAEADQLFLVRASGIREFRPVFEALSGMEVYNFNPRAIVAMQKPDPGEILRRDGSNAASVLRRMPDDVRVKIARNLARIVPGLSDLAALTQGSQETIEFRQTIKGQKHDWRFLADAMSDGTIRAFAILLAIYQAEAGARMRSTPALIGIEEPEIALHPAAAGILLSVLRDGARSCQILVTSHSPDLLDDASIVDDEVLAVENRGGNTHIGPVDGARRSLLKDGLFTAGELLRQDQLAPDPASISDVRRDSQLSLFERGL